MSGSLGNEAPAQSERGLATHDLVQQLRHAERVSQALREVGIALGTTFDLDDLLELILGKLTELVEADRATLYLLDEANDELVSRMVVGDHVRSIRMKVGHGIAGMVAQSGVPLRVRDAYTDPRFERDWDVLTGYRTTSILAAPLKNHLGRTIGVIQILNKRGAVEFTTEDEAILSALSTQAAVAIDNSRLFLSLIQKNKQLLDTKGELERRLRDLSLLFELERATGRATTLEELAQPLLSLSAKSTEARGAALLVAEEESGDLVEYVLDSDAPDKLLRIGVKAGEGLLAAAMSRGEMLHVKPGTKKSPYWHERVEGTLPFSVDTALVLPLEGEDGQLGAVALFGSAGSRSFTREDESLMQLVAANVSTAVRLFFSTQTRERSERLTSIGRLLSQVIHDFRTPMTVISGYVQLMADASDAKKRHEYSEEVLKQFDVLTGMQREVLEFARGERTLFVRRVYLHKFFGDLRRQLELELNGMPIELKLAVDTKVVARFDEARVARAVHNLARNAIEAMEGGGVLTLRGELEGTELLIAVSDTGPGIPPAIEHRLFQSFVTMGKEGGTGLGLAIVKKIVEEHGGSVTMKSSSKGATFELRLPQPELDEKKSTPRKSSKGQRSTP